MEGHESPKVPPSDKVGLALPSEPSSTTARTVLILLLSPLTAAPGIPRSLETSGLALKLETVLTD